MEKLLLMCEKLVLAGNEALELVQPEHNLEIEEIWEIQEHEE